MTAPINDLLTRVAAKWPGKVTLLRMIDYFCDSECPVVMNGVWLYNEPHHLSIAGIDRMMSRSEGAFREFLIKDGVNSNGSN